MSSRENEYRKAAMALMKLHETSNTELIHPLAHKILALAMGDVDVMVEPSDVTKGFKLLEELARRVYFALDPAQFEMAWEKHQRKLGDSKAAAARDKPSAKEVEADWAAYISSSRKIRRLVEAVGLPMQALFFHKHNDYCDCPIGPGECYPHCEVNGVFRELELRDPSPLWETFRQVIDGLGGYRVLADYIVPPYCCPVQRWKTACHLTTPPLVVKKSAWGRFEDYIELLAQVKEAMKRWIFERFYEVHRDAPNKSGSAAAGRRCSMVRSVIQNPKKKGNKASR